MAKAVQLWNLAPSPGSCPYARRALITLEEKNIPYVSHIVERSKYPQEFTSLYHSIWPDEKRGPKVPTIIDLDGTQLTESQVVVEYLEQRYKLQGTKLIPDAPAQAATARLFSDIFSAAFAFFPVLRATNQAQVAEAKATLTHGLQVLNEFLTNSGNQVGGDYVLGGQYSIADVYTAPLLATGSAFLEAYRDFDVLAEARQRGLHRFVSWAEAVLNRPSMIRTAAPKDAIVEAGRMFVQPLED